MCNGQSPALRVSNEFAAVAVSIDLEGNSPRLRIKDLKSGRTGWLDALELETFAWLRHDDLAGFFDPSATRWSDDGEASP